MDRVRLERRLGLDRSKGHVVEGKSPGLRDAGVDGGRPHEEAGPGNTDEDDGDSSPRGEIDHLLQVRPEDVLGPVAEQVVAAMTEDDEGGTLRVEDSLEPPQALLTDLAGDARVHDRMTGELLQNRGVAFGRIDAGSVGEAVPEGKDRGAGSKGRDRRDAPQAPRADEDSGQHGRGQDGSRLHVRGIYGRRRAPVQSLPCPPPCRGNFRGILLSHRAWAGSAALREEPHDRTMEILMAGRGILRTMSGPMAAASDPVEEPLLERARRGDRDAYEQLVGMHLSRVWRVVWRILRHHEDCEDVVQEVFLAAWQALPEYRGEARFSTWLHTIAVTRSLNYRDRAAEKVRRASSSLEPHAEEGAEAAIAREAERAGARGPSPLQTLEAGELRRRLAQCLEKLPPAWRAVLALRDGEELSYEDIARMLSVALGTVRSRLARARLGLRGCIEGHA